MNASNSTQKPVQINPIVRVLLYLLVVALWGAVSGAIETVLVQAVWQVTRGNSAYSLLSAGISTLSTLGMLLLARSFVFFSKEPLKRTVKPLTVCLLINNLAAALSSVLQVQLGWRYYSEIREIGQELGEVGVVLGWLLLPALFWWVIGKHFRKSLPQQGASLYVKAAILSLLIGFLTNACVYEYMQLVDSFEPASFLLALPNFVGLLLVQWKGLYADSMDGARKPDAAADGGAAAEAPASRIKTQEVGRIRGDGMENISREDARDTMSYSDGLEKLDREDELDRRWRKGKERRSRFDRDDGLGRFDNLENDERVIAASSREAIRVMEHNELQMKHDDRICDDDHK